MARVALWLGKRDFKQKIFESVEGRGPVALQFDYRRDIVVIA
jgi:hypothetical protein